MIEGLKPYPAYTETGLPWLGQIPATWKLRRAKYLFREVDERSRTGSEELLSVSHKTGVTPRSQKNVTMFMAESNVGHKVCRPDDLVINTLWAWMAALGVSRHHGMVSPAYGVYRPIDPSVFRPRFADQLLRTPFYAAEYQRCSTGVNSSRLRLYPEAFFRIPILMPPKEEQEAIVRFLAHANHKIDGFIRAKRKLIGLLNEQKQAIIHQAVTRGLDPSVPLKPSSIPWLGDIPKHWDAMPMKRVCELIRDGTHLPPPRTTSGFPLLSVRNIVSGRLIRRPDDSLISRDDFNQLNASFVVRKGDVLMAIVGATLGKVAIVEDIGAFQIQRSLAILRPRPNLLLPEYLATFLRSSRLQQHLWQSVAFSAQPGIYLGFITNIPIPAPPTIEEQSSICEHLNKETAPVNTAIARTEREIALMQEYRTRLTSDLVTGKLDVREAASKLPETLDVQLAANAAEEGDEAESDSDSESE